MNNITQNITTNEQLNSPINQFNIPGILNNMHGIKNKINNISPHNTLPINFMPFINT